MPEQRTEMGNSQEEVKMANQEIPLLICVFKKIIKGKTKLSSMSGNEHSHLLLLET